jgi:hypothetical protein
MAAEEDVGVERGSLDLCIYCWSGSTEEQRYHTDRSRTVFWPNILLKKAVVF